MADEIINAQLKIKIKILFGLVIYIFLTTEACVVIQVTKSYSAERCK